MGLRRRSARLWSDDEGLTLAEILIAMFILSVAIIAIASTTTASLVTLRIARDRERALDASSSAVETIRGIRDFDAVSFTTADAAAAAAADGTSDGCYDGGFTNGPEPVVGSPAGDAAAEVNHLQTVGKYTITTFITWVDAGADDSCPSAGHDRDTKRIIVVASWTDRGSDREVTQETFLSDAGRGLPVPDFELRPPAATRSLDTGGDTQCISHVLRNLGAEDGYEMSVSRTDSGNVALKHNALDTHPAEFRSPPDSSSSTDRWTLRTYLEYPIQTVPPDETAFANEDAFGHPTGGTAGDPDDWLDLLEDAVDPASEDRPETELRIPGSESGQMWFCYRAGSSLSEGTTAQFEVTVYSRFDDGENETVVHGLTVGTAPTRLFLFDIDDSGPHGRNFNTNAKGIYQMGPETGIQPALLGSTLFDWDSNRDTTRLPAVRIDKDDAKLDLIWDHQLDGAGHLKTFDTTDARLTFWAGSTPTLQGTDLNAPSIELEVTLEVLNSDQSPKSPAQVVYQNLNLIPTAAPDGNGWSRVDLDIDFTGSELSFSDGDYLRLRVGCTTASANHCHVAYDNTTYNSSLLLTLVSAT